MGQQSDPHAHLHSEQGALRGEHPGRAVDPVIKVQSLAWLEFEKPDLDRAENFARAFGFSTVRVTSTELHLRGTDPGAACVIIRRGPRSRFVGAAFAAAERRDVLRLADATDRTVTALPESIGGVTVDLTDPGGSLVRVVSDAHEAAALTPQQPQVVNAGPRIARINSTQRPPREPARIERVGHVVLQSAHYLDSLNWYLKHLGLIVSDFLYYEGQRERGPVMSFMRCDLGPVPSDHHTLALNLVGAFWQPSGVVCDLDAIAAGGEFLLDRGYRRSWGIGRHIQGSQIFDYWRDPDGFLVEHYADGDLFDSTLEPGWAPMTASGLAQWGPPATPDFLGIAPGKESLRELRAMASSLRGDTEFDLQRLRGLLKVAST